MCRQIAMRSVSDCADRMSVRIGSGYSNGRCWALAITSWMRRSLTSFTSCNLLPSSIQSRRGCTPLPALGTGPARTACRLSRFLVRNVDRGRPAERAAARRSSGVSSQVRYVHTPSIPHVRLEKPTHHVVESSRAFYLLLQRFDRRLLKLLADVRAVGVAEVGPLDQQHEDSLLHRIDPALRAVRAAVAERAGREHSGDAFAALRMMHQPRPQPLPGVKPVASSPVCTVVISCTACDETMRLPSSSPPLRIIR